jgi:hypothetical protein
MRGLCGLVVAWCVGGCVDNGTIVTYVRVNATGITSAVEINSNCACSDFVAAGSCASFDNCPCASTQPQLTVIVQHLGAEIARGQLPTGSFAGDDLVVEGHRIHVPEAFPGAPAIVETPDQKIGWQLDAPHDMLVTLESEQHLTCRESAGTTAAPLAFPNLGFATVIATAQDVVEGDGVRLWAETQTIGNFGGI